MPCGSMTIHADKTKVPEIKALSTRYSTRVLSQEKASALVPPPSSGPGSAKF